MNLVKRLRHEDFYVFVRKIQDSAKQNHQRVGQALLNTIEHAIINPSVFYAVEPGIAIDWFRSIAELPSPKEDADIREAARMFLHGVHNTNDGTSGFTIITDIPIGSHFVYNVRSQEPRWRSDAYGKQDWSKISYCIYRKVTDLQVLRVCSHNSEGHPVGNVLEISSLMDYDEVVYELEKELLL